jgi:hypothetical protein
VAAAAPARVREWIDVSVQKATQDISEPLAEVARAMEEVLEAVVEVEAGVMVAEVEDFVRRGHAAE